MIRSLNTGALRLLTVAAVSFLSLAHAHAAEFEDAQPEESMAVASTATDAELDGSRGAFLPNSFGLNTVEQTAEDKNNVVIGGFTGANVISNGSFTNTQGLVNVIQNSGNNVLIQSSTIVNLTFSK